MSHLGKLEWREWAAGDCGRHVLQAWNLYAGGKVVGSVVRWCKHPELLSMSACSNTGDHRLYGQACGDGIRDKAEAMHRVELSAQAAARQEDDFFAVLELPESVRAEPVADAPQFRLF